MYNRLTKLCPIFAAVRRHTYRGRVGHVPPWQGGGFLPMRATVTAGTSGHQSSSSAPPRHPGSLIRLEFLLGRSSSGFLFSSQQARRPWCSVSESGFGFQLRLPTSQNTRNKINWVNEYLFLKLFREFVFTMAHHFVKGGTIVYKNRVFIQH